MVASDQTINIHLTAAPALNISTLDNFVHAFAVVCRLLNHLVIICPLCSIFISKKNVMFSLESGLTQRKNA